MRDDENQNISIFGGFNNIGNGNLWMDKYNDYQQKTKGSYFKNASTGGNN